MAEQIEVSWRALTVAAEAQGDGQTKVARIESDRQAATLPAGSLGKLPASAEIQAAFDEAWATLGESLDVLGQALDGIAVRLTNIRDDHRDVDDQVGLAFGGGR